jgi:hypothetical protein
MEGLGEGEVVDVPVWVTVVDTGSDSVCSRRGICDDLCEMMFQSTNALATLILASILLVVWRLNFAFALVLLSRLGVR